MVVLTQKKIHVKRTTAKHFIKKCSYNVFVLTRVVLTFGFYCKGCFLFFVKFKNQVTNLFFHIQKKIKIVLKSPKKAVFIVIKIILLNVKYDHLFVVQSNQVFFSYLKTYRN